MNSPAPLGQNHGRRQLIIYHFMFDPHWEDGRGL